MDPSAFRHFLAGPGADTRGWVAFATVDAGTPENPSVRYKDANGKRMAPLVSVSLQPSGISVVCRVASYVAGQGEADWFPFVDGDEVVVVVPDGDERNGPLIIGRLNNDIDYFPEEVAGVDTSLNNVSFRRIRTTHITEVDGGYLVRSSKTGAQFGIDQKGQFILNDGAGNRLFMGADGMGIGSPGGDAFVQALAGKKQVVMGAGSASLVLDADSSEFLTAGVLKIGSSGVGATGHAITLEQVVSLLANMIITLNSSAALNPAWSATFAAGFPGTLMAILGAAITGAALPVVPITPATPGGNLTPLTGLQQLISAALADQGPDPAALGVAGIFQPGVGRPGFLY